MPSGRVTRGTVEPEGSYGDTSSDAILNLALRIDKNVKRVRPDGWRGIPTREQVIKAAIYDILKNEAEVERIFLIIKAQREY